MDQSKVDTEDVQLRLTALSMAKAAHDKPDGNPREVLMEARSFYQFLRGKDPLLDSDHADLIEDGGVHLNDPRFTIAPGEIVDFRSAQLWNNGDLSD